MVHVWSDVTTMNSMGGEEFTLIGCFVDEDYGARRCKWCVLNLKGPKTAARDYKFGWRRYERTRLIVI